MESCSTQALRIVLVDDYPPFRTILRNLFEEFSALEVIGEANDGQSAIETSLHLAPDIIIMDVKMPRLDGIEATRRIKHALPAVHVVGVSSQDNTVTREAMIQAGCSAFIAKEDAHTLPGIIAKITGRSVTTVDGG